MNILTGIQNVLEYINNNWTAIVIILSLIVAIVKKVKNLFGKSQDEKIVVAKKQIEEIMLKLITDAETDYLTWVEAGAVKRSQVINQIFEMYPILSKVTNQEELIVWIDNVIDNSLDVMREIFAKQAENKDETSNEVENISAVEAK